MLSTRQLELVLRDRTRFGAGAVTALTSLVSELGADRAFIVTDPGVAASGVAGRVADVLRAGGVTVGSWEGVEPNPGQSTVERGAEALRAFGTDGTAVIALGGGSSMDTAKTLSLAARNPSIPVAALGWENPACAPARPVLAIPTTAGTGAETNNFGVITDEAVGRKDYIGHASMLPLATVLDPELTLGLPPAPTAATGVDAMTHSLESLLSKNPNPFAEAMALHVIRTVGAWLPRAFADGRDLEARSQLLMASHLAGIGQASGTGVGLVHALGHALGTVGKLPHGTALAAVEPEVLAFYLGVRDRELALVAVALGAAGPRDAEADAARAAVAAVDALLRRVGQRRTLAELGFTQADEARIVADALADPAINNSPRLPDAPQAAAILAAVRG
ncbi:MAG: iron-containing alcohol dehydrogenase [Chloroflexota bacterium]